MTTLPPEIIEALYDYAGAVIESSMCILMPFGYDNSVKKVEKSRRSLEQIILKYLNKK